MRTQRPYSRVCSDRVNLRCGFIARDGLMQKHAWPYIPINTVYDMTNACPPFFPQAGPGEGGKGGRGPGGWAERAQARRQGKNSSLIDFNLLGKRNIRESRVFHSHNILFSFFFSSIPDQSTKERGKKENKKKRKKLDGNRYHSVRLDGFIESSLMIRWFGKSQIYVSSAQCTSTYVVYIHDAVLFCSVLFSVVID